MAWYTVNMHCNNKKIVYGSSTLKQHNVEI